MPELKIEDLTVVIDTREQTPWDLSPCRVQVAGLDTGDYSVKGLESVVAIERKSLADFVQCCGSERERFQRELDRLRGFATSAVVIEASWSDFELGQWRSKLTSKQVQASFVSWIAQGHRMILGRDHETAAKIARGILFYSARYRLREAAEIVNATMKVGKP
ncbi:MAG: ERCC4 domain-containing protein [Pirellula sp.]|jgi:DNA excision repair protein ERCC-4